MLNIFSLKNKKNNNEQESPQQAANEDPYLANEISSNRIVVIFSFAFFILFAIARVGIFLDYSESFDMFTKYLLLPSCVFMLVLDIIAVVYKFSRKWIKHMLMAGIIVICTETFFIFTIYVFYLIFIPIFLATRYFNKKFIITVTVITESLFIICCVLHKFVSPYWPLLSYMHDVVKFNSWILLVDALVYIFIPISTLLIFYCIFGVTITDNGKRLMKYQIESSTHIALVNAEINMAADIQNSALPDAEFSTPNMNFSIVAREVPAKEVGGDFYDYFMLDNDTLAVLVADVSDKGIPAAMFMMSAKKAIRCAAECCTSLTETVKLMNKLICQDNKSGMFITLWLGLIDINSGIGKYVNAGHLMPILKSKDGSLSLIENSPDLMMGNFPDDAPSVNYFKMFEGDTLVLYTDGITDAMNEDGRAFGMDRLMDTISNAPDGSGEMLEYLWSEETGHMGECEQFDDMTVLTLKCNKLEKRFELSISDKATFSGVKKFIDTVEEILKDKGCPDDVRRNVETVIDEVGSNIVEYAYDGEEGEMQLDISAGHNFIKLVFIDSGIPFNPLEKSDPEFPDEPQIGGLGIYLVKNLMDDVIYEYSDGKNKLAIGIIWNM